MARRLRSTRYGRGSPSLALVAVIEKRKGSCSVEAFGSTSLSPLQGRFARYGLFLNSAREKEVAKDLARELHLKTQRGTTGDLPERRRAAESRAGKMVVRNSKVFNP